MPAEFEWNGDAIMRAIEFEEAVGLWEAGEEILTRAIPRTPLQESTLRDSGHVSAPDPDGVYVSFNTPYAAYQHEAPEGWHYSEPGTGPHYLSSVIDESGEALVQHFVGERIKPFFKQ